MRRTLAQICGIELIECMAEVTIAPIGSRVPTWLQIQGNARDVAGGLTKAEAAVVAGAIAAWANSAGPVI